MERAGLPSRNAVWAAGASDRGGLPRFGLPHYLAIVGVPILLLELWTLTAWLADGPYQITRFRDSSSVSSYAAKVFEISNAVMAVGVFAFVARGCRRAKTLTFDGMLLLCGLTLFWADTGPNFFQPTFLYSSHWTNFNSVLGYMPFVVNPDIGRVPQPVMSLAVESAGILLAAMAGGWYLRWVRGRWPGISVPKQLGLLFAFGLAVDVPFELSMIGFGLWSYMGPDWFSLNLGPGYRFVFVEAFCGGLYFGTVVALREFRNDRGENLLERGLRGSASRRKGLTLLATYSFLQVLIWVPATVPIMAYGPYETPWPRVPKHLLNDICDAPGVQGTRYGPCPGSPGYRMPGRSSTLGPR